MIRPIIILSMPNFKLKYDTSKSVGDDILRY